MTRTIALFQEYLHACLTRFFDQNERQAAPPFDDEWLRSLSPRGDDPTHAELTVLALALMPHIAPRSLDPLFIRNKDLDRPCTEFGGWRGTSHGGFLPTGETAVMLVSGGDPANLDARREVMRILGREHWFHKENILRCEGHGESEPMLSGKLVVADEVLSTVFDLPRTPRHDASFPAQKITTQLDWDDLALPCDLREELDEMAAWLAHQKSIREKWRLDKFIKPGYRALFHGPPGTGKTLTATLLGQRNSMDVYRVDLSTIVSKYIGETEKNLAKIFDKAQRHNWILFFDEADALFGKRTETTSSNDRHANQEVAYLLQRIEDFPGTVILATNLRDGMDEAFFRRFQSSMHFPMPDYGLRRQMWERMLPREWLDGVQDAGELLHAAASHTLPGGGIVNAVQNCAIRLHRETSTTLTEKILRRAITKELQKESKIVGG